MTLLDDLPPDQRAVLLLLVQQGKSHAEIAGLLGISERSVRERAQAGLDALAEGPSEASPPRPPRPASRPPASRTAASRTAASRRAGALLLIALVAAIVVAVILLTGGGSSKNASTSATGTSATAQPHVDKQLNLTPSEPGSNAIGIAEVLSQGKQYAFFVAAEHMPPTSGFFYAAWLYNSPGDAQVLGRAPSVGSNGRLQAVGALPSNAAHYHQLLITRETATKPTHPGPIVLSGPFSLH
ncbi:MAG: RNA polymerase sigma factor [Solirubrobacterales bacterium]